MSADLKLIMRGWEEAKQIRMAREQGWANVANYCMPAKDFSPMAARPSEIIKRRVTSSLGARCLSRGAGLFVAYLIDSSAPFIGPNVKHALVRAGRRTNLSSPSLDYLGSLELGLFDAMMMPKSGYLASISRLATELVGFGNGVQWIGHKRGFGPVYSHRPFRSCWFLVNEDGEVDTLFFRYQLPAWRVLQKYPEAKKNDKLQKKGTADQTCQELVTLVHVVEPRAHGRLGAVATQKPFASVLFAVDEQCVLEESGYDSFPYAVARLNPEEGSAYGVGLSELALPDFAAFNYFQQLMEKSAGQRTDPPLMKPGRLFPKPLDRRPGAVNNYDASALGFQRASEAIQKLDIGGDPIVAQQVMDGLRRDAEEHHFIDWMSLNDGVQKTAEEIRDRRDLRLRAMSALVPAVDRDLVGRGADRTLEVMIAEGLVPTPPAELADLEVGWDYKGPLAMMQQRGVAEAVDRMMDLALKAVQIDPQAPHVLQVAEGLRAAAEALGAPNGTLRSREDFDKVIDGIAEKAANDKAMEQMQGGATSLRDGAQGLAALAGLSPSAGAGGRPPAMAA